MRPLTILEALREALVTEMRADPVVVVMGEDVRIGGGFGVLKGLFEEFGSNRVLDTPISETGFTGLAIGAAISGMHPVVEFQFGDFVFCAMDQIVNQAAKLHYMSDGQVKVPVVFRLPVGANRRGAQHAQCSESLFVNVAGLKIIAPAAPYDAKGLLISAIRDENPVLVFEHKLLYGKGRTEDSVPRGIIIDVPEESYRVPLGQARVCRAGKDVTVVATLLMLHRALEAATLLADEGIDVEVIDPRTLVPLDTTSITASVEKTRHLLVVEETQPTGSWGNEVVASVVERVSGPVTIRRLGTTPTPIPYATRLEDYVIPSTERIRDAIRKSVRGEEGAVA